MAWVVQWQHGAYVYPQPGGSSQPETPAAPVGQICNFPGPIQTWAVVVAPMANQLSGSGGGGSETHSYPISG